MYGILSRYSGTKLWFITGGSHMDAVFSQMSMDKD